MKKLSGIVQILGLLGCILLPVLFIFNLVQEYDQKAFYFFYIPFLLLPALGCKLLFTGDDSTLGKFFYKIGETTYDVLLKNLQLRVQRIIDLMKLNKRK
jgi:hypothetical protein